MHTFLENSHYYL